MSTATNGRAREHRVPIPRSNAPLCACGCGNRTSAVGTEYILGHRPRRTEAERFWSYVEVGGAEECWPWTRYVYRNGYAAFSRRIPRSTRYRREMAHRVAYELTTGSPVPRHQTIDHLCGTRACMNPAHMEVVSRGENSKRGQGWVISAAVRQAVAEVQCPQGHPRSLARKDRDGHWVCRPCRAAQARRRRAEAKQ